MTTEEQIEKKKFTVLGSFNLLYFRILDSAVMSAVLDSTLNVLAENVFSAGMKLIQFVSR